MIGPHPARIPLQEARSAGSRISRAQARRGKDPRGCSSASAATSSVVRPPSIGSSVRRHRGPARRRAPRHPTASGSGSESARDSTLPATIAWMGPSLVESIIKRAIVILAPPVGEARLTDPRLENQQRAGSTKIDDMWINKLSDEIVRWVERGPRYVPSDIVAAPSRAITAEPGPSQGHAGQTPFALAPILIALAFALVVPFRHQISRAFVRALSWNPVRHLCRQPVRRTSLPVSQRTRRRSARPSRRGLRYRGRHAS